MSGWEGEGWTSAAFQNRRSLGGSGQWTVGNSNSDIIGGHSMHTYDTLISPYIATYYRRPAS